MWTLRNKWSNKFCWQKQAAYQNAYILVYVYISLALSLSLARTASPSLCIRESWTSKYMPLSTREFRLSACMWTWMWMDNTPSTGERGRRHGQVPSRIADRPCVFIYHSHVCQMTNNWQVTSFSVSVNVVFAAVDDAAGASLSFVACWIWGDVHSGT